MNDIIKEKNCWDKNSIVWPFVEKYVPDSFKFVTPTVNNCTITHMTHIHRHMNETMEHKLHRIRHVQYK